MTDYIVNVGYKVDSSGLKNVDSQIKNINNTLDKSKKNADSVGASLKNALSGGASKLGVDLSVLEGGFSKAALAATAFTAVIAAAGFAASTLIKGLNEAQEINDLAKNLGVTAQELNELRGAAVAADTDFKGVTDALQNFSIKLTEARDGKKKSIAEFERIGLSVKELSQLSASDALFITTKTIDSMESYGDKQKAAASLLGSTSAAVIKLAGDFDTLKAAQKSGENNIFSPEAQQAAADYDNIMKEVKKNIDALYVSFVNSTAPQFVEFLNDVGNAFHNIKQAADESGLINLLTKINDLSSYPVRKAAGLVGSAVKFVGGTPEPDVQFVEADSTRRLGVNYGDRQLRFKGDEDAAAKAEAAAEKAAARAEKEREKEKKFQEDKLNFINQFNAQNETYNSLINQSFDTQAKFTEELRIQQEIVRLTNENVTKNFNYSEQEIEAIVRKNAEIQKSLEAKRAEMELNKEAAIEAVQNVAIIEERFNVLRAAVENQSMWDKFNENLQQVGLSAQGLTEGFADAFVNSLDSGKDAFRSFLKDITQQLIRSAIIKLIASIFGGGGVTVGQNYAAGGIDLSAGAGAKSGAAFNNGYQFFANGGIVNRTTPFGMAGGKTGVMGEAGPEAILPLSRMSNGKLGVAAGGEGGGKSIVISNNITINNSEDSDKTAKETAKAVNQLMETKVRKILAEESRSGNMLNPNISYT